MYYCLLNHPTKSVGWTSIRPSNKYNTQVDELQRCPYFNNNVGKEEPHIRYQDESVIQGCASPAPARCLQTKYRSYDGSCNNLNNATLGTANSPFQRLLPPNYSDSKYTKMWIKRYTWNILFYIYWNLINNHVIH